MAIKNSLDYLLSKADPQWLVKMEQRPPSIGRIIQTFGDYYEMAMTVSNWKLAWVLLNCLYIQCFTKNLSKEEIDSGLQRICYELPVSTSRKNC